MLDHAQQIALVDREIDVEGIDAFYLGQRCADAGRADNISGIHQVSADPAIKGCFYLGIAKIQLGEFDLRLGGEQRRGGRVSLILPAIHLGLRRGILFNQARIASQLFFRVPQRCLLRRNLRIGLLKLGLVLVLLNREQQIAVLNRGTVLKVDFFQISFDARHQRHGITRSGIAGEIEIFGHALGSGLGDRNRRGHRCRSTRIGAAADDAHTDED